MRLAAQVKAGFYPAHENAVAMAAARLQTSAEQSFAILDPCAGEGTALRQLSDLLRCPPNLRFAIELDDHRAGAAHAAMPESRVLAPADFFGCRASWNSFSFIWLNPPFDDAYGGSRVEGDFLRKATDWLMPGGVMALVCPENIIGDYTDARRHFITYYENVTVMPFPEDHRPFDEVVVFGYKRSRSVADRNASVGSTAWEAAQAPPSFIYQLPPSNGPRVFQKVEPTEIELQKMLANSPLRFHLKSPPRPPVPSPPLPLGIGHIALLLASGHLDGRVQSEGMPPHVVRGTSRKHSFISDVTDTENEDGSTTTRTTISERIELVIRTVDAKGHIETFCDTDAGEK